MQPTLHSSTHVLPGKKIEISAPELTVGDVVDVFIIAPKPPRRSRHSMINLLDRVRSLNKKHSKGEPLLSEPSALKTHSNMALAIEALEAIENYLSPEPGSLCEEMLNDALEGRIRLEATDIQDRMLIQHHAKKYIQQAIATLQRLNP